MNREGADCGDLTEKTADVIKNVDLFINFALTQQNNMEISMKGALQWQVGFHFA